MKLTSKDTLRALIKQRQMSYAAVAHLAGCHMTMISALVNGHRTSCTADLAANIAEALSVPLDILFVPGASPQGGQNVKSRRAA